MTAGTTGLEPPSSVPTGRAPGPVLTTRALRRWLPPLARRSPDLLTAYVLPGRVPPRVREARRVLRPGGAVRLLEHARSHHARLAVAQRRLAPAWARASGGCRLDHDVHRAVRDAGLRVVEERRRAGGVLVEIVAAA